MALILRETTVEHNVAGGIRLSAVQNGWLEGVKRVVSPHCDPRPDGARIELIVVHGISLPPGEYGGPWVERLFAGRIDEDAHPYFQTLRGLRVSAHLLVRRDGSLVQFVPFDHRAWHAGKSAWHGREDCNDFSIGIELEGCDDAAYADAQYTALSAAIATLRAHYPSITGDGLAGHSDIAPGRKSDPGPTFEWARLRRSLTG